MSSDKSDFVGPITPIRGTIEGIGTVEGEMGLGSVLINIVDQNMLKHQITIPNSLYAPSINHKTSVLRLLSPQHWKQQWHKHSLGTMDHRSTDNGELITVREGNHEYEIEATLGLTNIPEFYSAPGFNKYCAFTASLETDKAKVHTPSDVELQKEQTRQTRSQLIKKILEEDGLTDNPDQILDTIDFLHHNEHLHSDIQRKVLHLHHSMDHASFQKMKILSDKGMLPFTIPDGMEQPMCAACMFAKAVRRNRPKIPTHDSKPATLAGQRVSIDQLESSTPGFIAQTTGVLTNDSYRVATVFVDNYSRFSYIHLQRDAKAESTLEAKHAFEAMADSRGVRIQAYQADNGSAFTSHMFTNDCKAQGQESPTLCGVNAHHQNGKAERRVRELQDTARAILVHAHTKWPRAITPNLWPYALRMANDRFNSLPLLSHQDHATPNSLFGHAPRRSIILDTPFGCPTFVLNNSMQQGNKGPKWERRARIGVYLGHSPVHASSVGLILNLDTGHVSPQYHVKYDKAFQTIQDLPSFNWPNVQQSQTSMKSITLPPNIPDNHQKGDSADNTELVDPQSAVIVQSLPPDIMQQVTQQTPSPHTTPGDIQQTYTTYVPTTTRAGRVTRQPTHMDVYQSFVALPAIIHPDNSDTLYLHEAMKQPDREQWLKAMDTEIQQHEDNNDWIVVKRSDIPKDTRILPSVWAFRRKRRILTNEVYKWKARINVDGSKQRQGLDYDMTYAPVVRWETIRMFLVIAVANNFYTTLIDYVSAYTQAKIERTTYMHIPKGYKINDTNEQYVLQLINNLYGQKQAGRVWNIHLIATLVRLGFTQSKVDEGVLYYKTSVLLLYTDDTILLGPSKIINNQAIQLMLQAGLKITYEEGVTDFDFLGIHIQMHDKTLSMNQPHLIEQILQDLQLNTSNAKGKLTPCPQTNFPDDQQGPPADPSINYPSIIGKLLYLTKTRPDIPYTTNQLARYTSRPRLHHQKTLKHLGRYLVATKDKGINLKVNENEGLTVYCDASYVGDFQAYSPHVNDARSITGYVIKFYGFPILWASKKQQLVALSATEAEYIAMSQAIRDVIPIKQLIDEIVEKGMIPKPTCSFKTTVKSDNTGAIEMANNPRFRPRTKHIAVRFHHFQQHVQDGTIHVEYVHTESQQADPFTKPLSCESHEKHRKEYMGW